MESIDSDQVIKTIGKDTLDKKNIHINLEVNSQKAINEQENCKDQENQHIKASNQQKDEQEEVKSQNYNTLTKEPHGQNEKSQSKKALLELPDEDILIEFFMEDIQTKIDEFKAWYRESSKIYTSIDTLFTQDYAPDTEIVTQRQIIKLGYLACYKGQMKDKRYRHGIGLLIVPFDRIQESYFQNGNPYGKMKYVKYSKNNEGQIQFKTFTKRNYFSNTKGFHGFYQFYTQNGDVIEEGYEKQSKHLGEQKLRSENSIQYGKTTEGVELWH